MADKVIYQEREIRKYLIALLILLFLLLALLFAYYILTRPTQFVAGKGEVSEQADFRFLFSIYGFEGDLLLRPSSVCIGPDRRIYIADTGKHRVVIFDLQGNYIATLNGKTQREPYTFSNPVSVGASEDGRVFVLSKQDKKIVIFNRNLRPTSFIEFPNVLPTALYIKGNRVYVASDRAILIGTLEGRLVRQVGMFGKGKGQFDLPGGLVVDDNEIIYVADSLNYRVQAIDAKTGKAKWIYGKPLPPEEAIMFRGPERKFGLPASITLDERGRLYVVDGTNSEIVVLDAKTGKLIKTIGEIGHQDGRFYYPDGIYYGEGGYIAVADKFNDRVEIFRVPVPGIAGLIPRWLPWLALLPLIFLLIWLLFRRRVKFVAAPDFINAAIEREYLKEIARSIKKLYVTPATFEMFANQFSAPELVKVEAEKDKLKEIQETFKLDLELTEVLTVAYQLKGKKALLAEGEPIRKAADKLDIANMNLDELIKSKELSEKADEGAAS